MNRTRTNWQKEEQRAEVARLMARGYTVRQIAKETHRAQTSVFEDMDAVREGWRSGKREAVEFYMSKALTALDEAEIEAWLAWERSKLPRRKGKVTADDDALTLYRRAMDADRKSRTAKPRRSPLDLDGDDDFELDDAEAMAEEPEPITFPKRRAVTVERLQRDGDPRFLDLVVKIQERRARLLGLDKQKDADGEVGTLRISLEVLQRRAPLINKAVSYLRDKYPDAEIAEFRELETE